MGWQRICKVDELPVQGSRVIERPTHAGGNVAVFRTASDRVLALLDRCPHKGGPLSQGIVYGESVACPLHNWSIDLNSGCAIAPDQGCTQRFPTRIDAGTVYIDLDGGERETAEPRPVEQVGADD